MDTKVLPRKTSIIFDFDGTIADSAEAVAEILMQLSGEYGYPALDRKNVAVYRNKSAREFIREDLKISWLRLPFFAKRVRKELNKRIGDLKPFGGMSEVIKVLKEKGFRLGIISSNSAENINLFLSKNTLDTFDFIVSGSSIFGKQRVIAKTMVHYGLNIKDTVYVGDEVRDFEAAQKVSIDSIIVSWGYNSKEGLEKHLPGLSINSPKELLGLLRYKL